MQNQTQFVIGRSENIVQKSKEIGSNAALVVGVRWAEVKCACGHEWRADERNGLRNVMGGVHLACPVCKAEGMAHVRVMRGS